MTAPFSTRDGGLQIKICCIASVAEAQMALECGANFLGLVSAMPSGPGVIADELITEIRAWVGDRAKTVLLTCRTDAKGIREQLRTHSPHVIQLCDAVSVEVLNDVRNAHPEVALMQVIHVRDDASVAEACEISRHVDALLLDSGNPSAAIKELGGTGRIHDWRLSQRIREGIDQPLFLAGGLRSENVADAVRGVRPWGVDVCSGVRTDGILVKERLAAFVRRARET